MYELQWFLLSTLNHSRTIRNIILKGIFSSLCRFRLLNFDFFLLFLTYLAQSPDELELLLRWHIFEKEIWRIKNIMFCMSKLVQICHTLNIGNCLGPDEILIYDLQPYYSAKRRQIFEFFPCMRLLVAYSSIK